MKQKFKQWAWRALLTLTCLLITTPAWADTWTVAGSDANLFGTTWDPSNTANDMKSASDGYY